MSSRTTSNRESLIALLAAFTVTDALTLDHSSSWESSYEFIVPDKDSSTVTVRIIDDRDFAKDPLLGYVTVSLQDLLTAKDRQQDWFPLSRAKTGRVRLTAEWKPLDLPGSVNGAGSYTAPIGILRILLKKAVDVKNVEALLGGKSDPYVRVLSHGNTLARSEVVNNSEFTASAGTPPPGLTLRSSTRPQP